MIVAPIQLVWLSYIDKFDCVPIWWEDELEYSNSDIFEFTEGDGTGSEISLKTHKTYLKKFPNRLICMTREVFKSTGIELDVNSLENDIYFETFEPIDSLEKSAFCIQK